MIRVYAAYACRGRGRITGATEGSVTGAKVYPCALRVTDRWVHARARTHPVSPHARSHFPPPSPLHPPTPRIEYTCTHRLFSVSRDRSWYTTGSIGGTFLCAFLWANDDPKSMDFSLIKYGYTEEKGRVVIAVAMIVIIMMSDARERKDALRDAGKWRGCNLINSILVIAWLVVHSRQCYSVITTMRAREKGMGNIWILEHGWIIYIIYIFRTSPAIRSRARYPLHFCRVIFCISEKERKEI